MDRIPVCQTAWEGISSYLKKIHIRYAVRRKKTQNSTIRIWISNKIYFMMLLALKIIIAFTGTGAAQKPVF
jgi:hypothetical protein